MFVNKEEFRKEYPNLEDCKTIDLDSRKRKIYELDDDRFLIVDKYKIKKESNSDTDRK